MLAGLRSFLGFGDGESKALPARQRLDFSAFPAAIYAIGDIHGCLQQLRRLHDVILADGARYPGEKVIVMLGDYVDRGPDSAATLDFLLEPLPGEFQRVCLCGNHDEMMQAHVVNPQISEWLNFGGMETLTSYGIDARAYRDAPIRQRKGLLRSHIPGIHVDFLANLPIMVSAPGVLFSHAGIRPDMSIDDQDDADLMWPVHDYEPEAYSGWPLIVHGHTPFPTPVVLQHKICVDTGCFATGVLTAVRLRAGEQAVLFKASAD